MSWTDVTFTFPFTMTTLVVAVIAYLATSPFLTRKLNQAMQLIIWLVLAIVFAAVFPIGYGLRFLLAIGIMMASRMRLVQTGLLKEVLMIVITLVTAMLFVGLR